MNKKIVIPAIATILLLSMTSFMPAFAEKQGKGPPEDFWKEVDVTGRIPSTRSYTGKKTVDHPDGIILHSRGGIQLSDFTSSIGNGTREVAYSCDCNYEPGGYPEMKTLCHCRGKVEMTFTEGGEGTLSGIMQTTINYTIPLMYGHISLTHGTGDYEGVHVWATLTCDMPHPLVPNPHIVFEGKVLMP